MTTVHMPSGPMFNRMNTYCFLYLAKLSIDLRDWVEPVFILLFWITVINNITENPVCGIKAIEAFYFFWNTIDNGFIKICSQDYNYHSKETMYFLYLIQQM